MAYSATGSRAGGTRTHMHRLLRHGLQFGSRSCCFHWLNEGLPRVAFVFGRPYQPPTCALTVDWPCDLWEIQAPFTSRSPGIATLGPSWTPRRQLSLTRDLPTNESLRRDTFSESRPNRQLAGQSRRWESNPPSDKSWTSHEDTRQAQGFAGFLDLSLVSA